MQDFNRAHFNSFARDFYAQQRKAEQWQRHKSQYHNASYEDFSRNYDALKNNQSMRANTQYGLLNDFANSFAYDNSFTSGITDTAATWLAGGANLLGQVGFDTKDFANRADNLKRQIRINHDVNRGDSGFSNFAYGAGTIAPELILPAGQIKLGAGLALNALRGAGWGAVGGGLTSLLDSDQSMGQTLGGAALGAGAGGAFGGLGASILGRINGYGWANSPKAGLLNSTIDDAGNIKVDTNIGATNANDDAIARAMNAQQTASQPNFVMGKSGETITNYNVPIEFEQWVKNAAGINPNKEIIANLYTLAKKHPEMFNKPSDVYRLIREVKNPTFFYRNNRPDIALMGKFLEDGKVGKIGIVKDGEPYNIVGHATTRNVRASNYQDVVGTADPTLPLLPYHGGGQRPGANAHSHLDKLESTVGSPTVPTQPTQDQGVGANARSLIPYNPTTSNLNNSLENAENAASLGRAIGETNVYINNDRGYHATIQIVQADKLKPSFEENVGGQFRTQKQDHVIHKIRDHFDPMLMFERSGDFNGIPVVDNNGIVLVGNHRTEALKSFSPEQFDKYAKAVQDKYGIKLNNGELVVRVLDPRYNKEERENLAKASNVGRENNFFEKEIAEDAKYAQNLGDFLGNRNVVIRPDFDEASDVVRMKNLVAGALKMPLDSERANSVLLHSLLQSGQHGFLKRLDSLALDDARTASAIHTMLRDNAGALYLNRISQNASAIDIVPYLHSTLNAIRAQKGKTYPQIKKYIEEEAKHILLTSEENLYRLSRLSEPPIDYFEQLKGNMIACALGKLLTRTNPSEALYGILKQFGKEQNHGENIFGDEFKITLWDNLAYLNRISGESPLGNMLESIKLKEKEFAQYATMRDMQGNTQMSLKPNVPFDMKTMHKLKAAAINAPTATQQQYEAYYKAMWSGDKEQISKTLPFIKIAHFNETFSKLFGIEKQAVFFTKQSISHVRESRKVAYNQDLPEAFVKDIPNIINNAQGGFYDKAHRNFFIVKPLRDYGIDSNQLGFIHFNKDILGNYIVTMKRADADSLHHSDYIEVGRGVAPHIPNEQTSLASPFLNASPTSNTNNPTPPPLKNGLQSNTFAHNLAHHVATNALAGTAGGIANVALDDSPDSVALKFAKGFAAGVALKVAAKHGTNAGARAAKQAFDDAMQKSAQFSTLLHENPQLFTRFLNKQLTDDFAQFGGARSGLHAQRYAVAKELAQKGVSDEEILARTGWFRGLDSQWKFQLDLRGGAAYKLKEGTYELSQLCKQDSLYAAYPFLRKVRVQIARLPEAVNGSFEPTTGILTLNSANNKLDFTKALAHELQHIIQRYEGFAQGSSPSNAHYWSSAGEVEARATFKNGENNPRQRLASELQRGREIQSSSRGKANDAQTQPNRAYSIAGQKAATADQSALQNARELQQQGKSAKEIWEKTGWYLDKDSHWKFEINPKGGEVLSKEALDNLAEADPHKMVILRLDEVLKDKTLFESYPQFKDVKVVWESSKGLRDDELYSGAFYNPKTNEITLGNGLTQSQIKSGLYHEIQHHIQRLEGFADGGSTRDKNYQILHGEVEARNVQGRIELAERIDKQAQREAGDIHAVTYGNKKATLIQQDLESVESALRYTKGYHNTDGGKGAEHIKIRHLTDPSKEGYVTQNELENLGVNIRKFLAQGKEPFVKIDKQGRQSRIYEWENESGDRFRMIATNSRAAGVRPAFNAPRGLTSSAEKSLNPPLDSDIITFYSDRNLKNKMIFENPAINAENAKLPLSSLPHPHETMDTNIQDTIVRTPLDNLKSAQGRIDSLRAFAKYLANPPAHLRGDVQRLRADKAAMRELDAHMRKAEADKANAIDALAYQ